MNGWSDLNETWYIEGFYVSDAPFSIRIGSMDIRGWRGETEILEMLRVERLGWNLMGKVSTSYRYVIDIIGTDLFTLEELGGVDLEN